MTDYYEGLGEFIVLILGGYNSELKKLSDGIAGNMEQAIDKAMKVPCITRRS